MSDNITIIESNISSDIVVNVPLEEIKTVVIQDTVTPLVVVLGNPAGADGPQGIPGVDGAPGPNQVTTSTSTNITGILKGTGTYVAQASAGSDYQAPLSGGTDYLRPTTDVDDVPVDGETAQPISSNWAYDHVAAADPHTGYMLESNIGTGANNYLQLAASPGTPDGTKFFRDDRTWATPPGVSHDAVTLSTDLSNNLLGLSTQQLTLDNQTNNYVFAGPATGGAGVPAFRALVAGDVPTLNQNTTGTAAGLTAQYIDWSSSSGGNSIANKPTIPVKATGAELITGTDDAKFATAKALKDAGFLRFAVSLLPGSFNLIGVAAEPLLAGTDGTNFDYHTLQFIDGATEQNAFFMIPSRRTALYSDHDIKIDIDFLLVGGTLTNGHTIIFGVGLVEVNDAAAFDIAPPTTGTGFSTATYTLGASETTLYKHTITVTITADSSISAGQTWIGRLIRKTGTDTSVASAYVTGITVYE